MSSTSFSEPDIDATRECVHRATALRAANGVANSEMMMTKEPKSRNRKPMLFAVPFHLEGLSGKFQRSPPDIREGATFRQRSGTPQTEIRRRLSAECLDYCQTERAHEQRKGRIPLAQRPSRGFQGHSESLSLVTDSLKYQ